MKDLGETNGLDTRRRGSLQKYGKRRKCTRKSRSEENVVGFSIASQLLARKKETVTQGGNIVTLRCV